MFDLDSIRFDHVTQSEELTIWKIIMWLKISKDREIRSIHSFESSAHFVCY